MTLKIFAGDFKSGSTEANGFRLKSCGGMESLAQFIPFSRVQTLERFDDIRGALTYERCGVDASTTPGFGASPELIADDKTTDVTFIVRFKDGQRMVASVEGKIWDHLVLKVVGLRAGSPSAVLRSSVISESYDSCERFDQIDWVAATPSWLSIVVGAILPVPALVTLAFTIDAVLCLAFEQWIGYFWAVPLWLVGAIAFPLALIGTVVLANLLTVFQLRTLGNPKSSSSISRMLQRL
jgi:hypothetical protein